MQIFCPYPSPLDTARCLNLRHLNNQCNEAKVVLDAINGCKAWAHHPVVVMYIDHREWLVLYRSCLLEFMNDRLVMAEKLDRMSMIITPQFLTEEFCHNMRRRMYTKDPNHYKIFFGDLEPSDENWYWSPSENRIVKYCGGKRID